jgi:hypothetical protein
MEETEYEVDQRIRKKIMVSLDRDIFGMQLDLFRLQNKKTQSKEEAIAIEMLKDQLINSQHKRDVLAKGGYVKININGL